MAANNSYRFRPSHGVVIAVAAVAVICAVSAKRSMAQDAGYRERGRGTMQQIYQDDPAYYDLRDGLPSSRSYYPDDPGNDGWGDEDPASPRQGMDRAAIDPDAGFEGDAGDKDDDQAALARSPIPRTIVPFTGFDPGTIVISTKERRLYLVLDDGTALKYGIGVGKQGFSWKGAEIISRKAEWPTWTPPKEMIARRPELPDRMEGGMNNPLGARALYLGSTLYRIHGTNEPNSIGKAVSSGCIRMANPDVMDLYERVGVGAKVVVR